MQSNYAMARLVLAALQIFGWITVAIGVLTLLSSFADMGGGQFFFALVPGIGLAAAGIVQVAFAQIGGALLDTASNTGRLCEIMLSNSGARTVSQSQGRAPEPMQSAPSSPRSGPLRPGDTIKTYKGHAIVKREDGVSVGDRDFDSLLKAEKHINDVVAGNTNSTA